MSSSDAVFRKSAENAEKSFKRAADAAGAVRVEEAKLDDLRSKGTGATALLVQSERLDKARRAESATTRTAVSAMRDLDDAHNRAANSGTILASALQGIAQGATNTRVGGIAASIEGIGTKGILAAAGIGVLATGVVAAGKAVYDLGARWDSISDTITGRTGLMGNSLKAVTDSIKQVGSQSAVSLEDIGHFAGGVAQSLHLTGVEATAMTQKLADIQQVTNQAVDTKDLGKAFRLFDVTDVNTEIQTLQQLTAASQSTDVPINDLITNLNSTGKASHEAGLNLQQTLGVLLTLEESGVSFEKAGPALSIALKNWSKDGRDANVALAETITQIKQLVDAGNSPAATKLAAQTFGKGYIDFLDAIKGGALDVNNLTAALDKLGATGDVIGEQKKSTEDWHEQWQKLTNTLSSKLKPVADVVFGGINSELQYMTGNLNDTKTGVDNLASSINSINPDKMAALMGVPGAAAGAPAGLPPTPAAGSALGQSPTIPVNPQRDWITGQQRVWDPKTRSYVDPYKQGSGSGPKLPDAPVLPYDTNLPQGFAGLPQTTAILSAENSYMDARHTLAEKQARVQQLEQDNNATAADIQKAKNDVVNAQQGQQQAESQLIDAQQSLYDKANKQLKGYANQMGDIGVQLDQDLGISKGLPGIAENLVKFLANLAAAPLLGQLSAVANAPGQAAGGSGLMGVLGAQGVFGSQYTAAGQAAASGQQAGQAYATGSSDAALLANVPAGRYDASGDLSKGLGDCSSAVEDLVNIMDGRPTAGRSMSTGNEADWLTQHGFMPGMGGPGDFRVGFNSEHTQATLPGGTPFNWGSDEAAARGGVGGTGADDPAFTSHYYRPAGASGGPVGSSQSGGLATGSGVVPVFVTNMGGMPGGMLGAAPGSPASGRGSGPAPGPGGGGLTPDQWRKIAGGESSGNWQANTGNGFSGGLQFTPSTWNEFGGGAYAPQAFQATPEQQMDIANKVFAAQGTGAWPGVSAAHPDWFQPAGQGSSPTLGTGPTFGAPGPPTVGGGQGPILGANSPAAGGPGVGTTAIGGLAPTANPSGGGVGITPGGTIDTAMNLAASGLDLLAPGAGQAAQTGMKLANRAIQYGAQVGGIAVGGLLDTFLPSESPLANVGNSWFGKLASGVAGARPALPNIAGKQAPKQGQQQGKADDPNAQPGQGQGGQTNNITVNNHGATEDGNGKDVARHLEASHAAQMPGFG